MPGSNPTLPASHLYAAAFCKMTSGEEVTIFQPAEAAVWRLPVQVCGAVLKGEPTKTKLLNKRIDPGETGVTDEYAGCFYN